MRTIVLILIGITILILCLVGANALDVAISSGPQAEAQAQVIAELAPRQTAQALEIEVANALVNLAAEKQRAEQAANNRRIFSQIAIVAGAGLAVIVLGIGAGLLAERAIRIYKAAKTPPSISLAPYISIIRTDQGDLRIIDMLTGSNFALLADKTGDPLRAANLTRIEMANNLARNAPPAEVEILPTQLQPQDISKIDAFKKSVRLN